MMKKFPTKARSKKNHIQKTTGVMYFNQNKSSFLKKKVLGDF